MKLILLWLLLLIFILYFGYLSFPKSEIASNNFFENFTNWDGKYYLSIAKYGYIEDSHYAFFPGYPLAIKFLTTILGNYILSAIIISIISTILAIYVLYKLVKMDFNKLIAEKSILALLFFPTSFYFMMGYSEGLYLFLSLSTIYFYRKGNIFYATFFGILASGTRIFGLILILALFIQILMDKGFNRKNWLILLSPAGFIAYCVYLYINKGDPFYFISVQTDWSRTFSLPWTGFWQAIYNIFQPHFLEKYFYVLLNLVFAIFGLGMSLRSFRFLPPVYSLYALGCVLLPIFSSTLSSMPRLLIPVFPLFILIALIRNKFLIISYQTISLLLLSVLAVLFFNGYWVS